MSTPAATILAADAADRDLAPIDEARTPCPASASKEAAAGGSRPRSAAAAMTAAASGCSEPCSAAAARRSAWSRLTVPSSAMTSVTLGLPSVMVPVLSSTTASSVCAVSSEAPSLMRMPFSAPLPVPTMMAVGVARPRAQGHAMTSTATKFSRA